MTHEKIGQAQPIRRRGYFQRGKGYEYYWDFSPWGGGWLRRSGGPGGIIINETTMGDIRTGEVFRYSSPEGKIA